MGRQKPPVVSINPLFKLLIVINLALCGICLVVMVVIGMTTKDPNPPELQRQLYSACETVFKMTAGAFIGLMAGRAAAPDANQPSTSADKPIEAGTEPTQKT